MKRILNKIHTAILMILAAGTPVAAVLDEKFWFEKRVLLTGAAILLLALLAIRVWGQEGIKGIKGLKGIEDVKETGSLGWLLFGVALVAAAAVPAGRMANLMAPDLWAAVGAVLAYFAIRNTMTGSKMVKWGFVAAAAGMVAACVIAGIKGVKGINVSTGETLQILQHSPIFGEFREFRVARLGILQIAGGLGILGILSILGLTYQLVTKSAKEIFKSSGLWQKLLNLLVLVLLAAFLVLPSPALTLWSLAVVAALAGGMTLGTTEEGREGKIGGIRGFVWAGAVGLLVVVVLGSSYGLGRVVWGEIEFREALAAANRNDGIATYYALRETIKRNPYEVRYHLLASQIDLALANSIAAQARENEELRMKNEGEATESAQLTAQDQNNIMILIQEAVVEGKKAVRLDPENSALWQNLASIYRSLSGIAEGAEDWALKCFERAAELAPRDPNPPLQVGTIHFLAGNYQGAKEAFEKAVELQPNWPLARYNLAAVFNEMGEVDKAIEQLRETLTLLPTDSPDRERVEKDLAFLEGDETLRVDEETLRVESSEKTETEELKEATTSAEVEAPPPPVGPPEAGEPEEATESATENKE